jgi:hypothetical protein
MLNPFDPMPTIKAILGWPAPNVLDETIMLDQLDFDIECSDSAHPGEYHEGPAAYLVTSNVHQNTGFACARIVDAIRDAGGARCRCGLVHMADTFTFLPIAGTK